MILAETIGTKLSSENVKHGSDEVLETSGAKLSAENVVLTHGSDEALKLLVDRYL